MPATISTKNNKSKSKKKNGKRIFLVDDEPDITMAISVVLKCNGFDVYSYTDPVLVLSSFKPHYYDLVILDVKMPKMDGFELYNEIRKADDKARVCFITATDKFNYEAEDGVKSENHRHEYNDGLSQPYCALRKDMFIQKPISNDDLINEINNRVKAR